MSHPLAIAVSAAVPLRIAEYLQRGGPAAEDWDRARRFGATLGEKGDKLLYRGEKVGETAELFNQFTDALAVLAFLPGGVRFCGEHWDAGKAGPAVQSSETP